MEIIKSDYETLENFKQNGARDITTEEIEQEDNIYKTPSNNEYLDSLKKFLEEINIWNEIAIADPFDSADTLEEFEPSDASQLIEDLGIDVSIKIFESLRPRAIIEIVENLKETTVEKIFREMDTEDVVDVFERSTVDEAEDLLDILDKSTKLDINRRLAYPKDSVGRLMSEEVAKISIGLTIKEALVELKSLHENVEDLLYVYSVDDENRLSGVVSFREIVFADEDETIDNVMIQNPIFINPSLDQEEAARLIKQYELLALPVVDKNNKLIGQTTVSSALDIIESEIGEDFSQSFGAGAEENIFTPIRRSLSMRLPWIIVNLFLAFIVSYLVAQFEDSISSNALLAALMPVVALVGGNSGAQSLAIVIRALAKNDVSDARVFEVIAKQTLIGLLNGFLVALISITILFIFGLGSYAIPLGIAILFNILIIIID